MAVRRSTGIVSRLFCGFRNESGFSIRFLEKAKNHFSISVDSGIVKTPVNVNENVNKLIPDLNLTSPPPHFDLTLSPDDDPRSILSFLPLFRPEFSSSSIVRPLSGSATNALFIVVKTGASLVVRINCPDTVVDRKLEIANWRLLARRGLAPSLVATFDNGVVYEFVEGRTLTRDDLKDLSVTRSIAFEMAKLHRIRPEVSLKVESVLWSWMDDYISLIHSDPCADEISSAESRLAIPSPQTLRRDVADLRVRVESFSSPDSPFVFCHNDLNLDNVVFREMDSRSRFIDWEFGGWNWAPFDVANHFNESYRLGCAR